MILYIFDGINDAISLIVTIIVAKFEANIFVFLNRLNLIKWMTDYIPMSTLLIFANTCFDVGDNYVIVDYKIYKIEIISCLVYIII